MALCTGEAGLSASGFELTYKNWCVRCEGLQTLC